MRNSKGNPVHVGTFRTRRLLAMSMLGAFVLLSAFVARVSYLTATLAPVASVHAQQNMPVSTPEPSVDGSKHPEQIPDDVAIRALMQTIRIPLNPDAAALKQLHARVDKVDLSNADFDVLVREVGILDARAKEQEIRLEAMRPSSGVDRFAVARYREEQAELRSLMAKHYQQLLASLSAEGALKVQEHLWHVKSQIKIYPMPNMFGKIKIVNEIK